jgi:WD40 repeat protein
MILSDPAWRGNEMIVSTAPSNGDPKEIHLAVVRVHKKTLVVRRLQLKSGCRTATATNPLAITSESFVFLERCWTNGPLRSVSLLSLSVGEQTPRRVVRYFLPFSTKAVASDRNLGLILVNDGVGLREHLWNARKNSLVPVRLPFARIGAIAASPSGEHVAVAVGAQHDPTTSWRLYLLNKTLHVERRLSGSVDAIGRPAWSPDGRSVAVVVRKAGTPDVLQVISVDNRAQPSRTILRSRGLGSVAWSSDGKTIAVAAGGFETSARSGLYLVRAPD